MVFYNFGFLTISFKKGFGFIWPKRFISKIILIFQISTTT